MKRQSSTFRRQWGWPIGIAVLTMFGLLSALLGEGGVWWWLSWAALSLPLLVVLRHVLRSSMRGEPRHACRHGY